MKLNSLKNILIKQLRNQVFHHIIFWLGAFILLYLTVEIWEPSSLAFEIAAIIVIPAPVPVYLHFFVLKQFFERRRYIPYVLSLIIIVIVSGFLVEYIFWIIVNDPNSHTSGIGLAIFYLAFSTALKYYRQGIKNKYRLQEAEFKQLQTELALLKSQVNPHFFFNTLNNLYALSLGKSERVPEMILKISNLMRYVMDSSRKKEVELNQEIEFLKNYIALEKLRFRTESDIQFQINGQTEGKRIAPLLLIPFIENSFKHGANSTIGNFYIHMKFIINENGLSFLIKNNKQENYKADSPSSLKSGLNNVKRRLELLYPNKHKLEIQEKIASYEVHLEISL
jgi:two-component system LytT family sensor kinase